MLKAALYIAAGVVVGSAATFFAIKGHFQKKCESEVEQAWKDAREHYIKQKAANDLAEKNRKEKEERAKKAEETKEVVEEVELIEPERKFDIKKLRREAERKVQSYRRNVFDNPPNKRDIHIIEDGEDAVELDEGGWEEEADDTPREGLREFPYVISAEEFANEHVDDYDKITIYLYPDGVAVDSREKIVDDIDAIAGKENMDRIEELADADGTVLIRNEMRSSDYELLLMNEPYIPDTAPVRDD